MTTDTPETTVVTAPPSDAVQASSETMTSSTTPSVLDMPKETAPLATITAEKKLLDRQILADMGFILPVVPVAELRAALDEKQRLLAALLGPEDYLYTVVGTNAQGRAVPNTYDNIEHAKKASETYKSPIKAKPKKSGVTKLAVALGIDCERVEESGLPGNPKADYAYVKYRATHARTGKSAYGIGWCDTDEQRNKHNIITIADTRAYDRAVLRLTGFSEATGDEVIEAERRINEEDDDAFSAVADDVAPQKQPEPLPPISSDNVIAASRAWAEKIVKRTGERFVATAQQNGKGFRELRARARRGDEAAGAALGAIGGGWYGRAQDGLDVATFVVDELPPVQPEDISRVKEAAAPAAAPTASGAAVPPKHEAKPASTEAKTPERKPDQEQRPATTAAPAAPPPPAAVHGDDIITRAQAKAITDALLLKLGTKDTARAWLLEHALVKSSTEIKSNDYDALMAKIKET